MKRVKVVLLGLDCRGCLDPLANAMLKINGVKKSRVNPNKDGLVIDCEESTKEIEIEKLVRNLGYVIQYVGP